MADKAFITGISGFAGSYLAELLLSTGKYEVSGTYLSESSLSNVESIKDSLTLRKVNLLDEQKTTEVIHELKPDVIFHLAALPAVGDSLKQPKERIMNNVGAQINVLESVLAEGLLHAKILIVSSADVYGKVSKQNLPIDEDTPLNPTNSYAVSKITQDFLGLQYFNSYNLPIIRVRPFNHIGPRQTTGFVVSDFAKKIVDIEKGKGEPILKVGDLSAKRDFTDVRDVVKGYLSLIEKGNVGEVYNIGSGESYKVSDILDMMIAMAHTKVEVKIDESLLRPHDVSDRICDNTKITKATNWKPIIDIQKSLQDTLDYWRSLV